MIRERLLPTAQGGRLAGFPIPHRKMCLAGIALPLAIQIRFRPRLEDRPDVRYGGPTVSGVGTSEAARIASGSPRGPPTNRSRYMEFNPFDVSAKELVWDDPAAWRERFGIGLAGPVEVIDSV